MFRARQYFIFFFLISLLTALFTRLFYLQVLNYDKFSEMAADQHNSVLKVEPRRGTIFDRFKDTLAINLDAPSVYCDPRSIKDKEKVADFLSRTLDADRETLSRKLSKDKAFIWVKRKIDKKTAKKIKKENLTGVHFLYESERNYSNDNMASHAIGFVGMDNEGLEGLELLFNEKLRGEPGWRHLIRDARRKTVLFNERESIPPKNGYNLVLTIDSVIQYIVEEELEAMAEKFNASGASIIVMDPFTGEILAIANWPDYDLNAFSETPRELMKNSAVSNVYEPGSVFKIVTASAALNEDRISLEEKIYCENGEYRVGGRILHDFHRYGDLSFSEVISKSSNIGTVKVAQKLGEDKVYEYIKKFGFGSETGVDLPGEVEGISRPPAVWSRSDITTIPIGQGIAVTPLQMACAISAIANGGHLMQPYIVDRITTWEGGVYKQFEPVSKGRILNEETSEKMKDILRKVVTEGTGKRARSKLYQTCGKTGTAQMVNPRGGYYPDKYHATFIGFAPKDIPAISIVVTAADPHPVHFGGSVAGPAFKKIAERTLQYLNYNKTVSVDRNETERIRIE